MITVYFLRHGESTGVQQRILQGHQDHPLTAFGKAQAASLSNHWLAREISFDQIITSPLLRARQTAEIIASLLDVPLLEDEIWIERHFGNGEGVDLSVIENWYADHPLPLPHEPIYDTGESAADLHLRAAKALQPLLLQDNRCLLVVSHGSLLNAVLHTIFGLSPSGRTRLVKLALDPCAYALTQYDPQKNGWSLLAFNRQS